MASPAAIRLKDVTCRLGGSDVLDHIDLEIPDGQFVALVGESGSGKTTLLRTINGLAAPSTGNVCIAGVAVGRENGVQIRRAIGYVIQEIGLFPHMTVAGNIWIVPRISGLPRAGMRARVAELLALVGLPATIADRLPSALSGGQAQRVGVARALAMEPSIMLMDEPFGALDPVTRDSVARSYRALHDRLALTTVMVTHDMLEALLLADRVIALSGGRIVGDMTPAALLRGEGGREVRALVDIPAGQRARLDRIAAAG